MLVQGQMELWLEGGGAVGEALGEPWLCSSLNANNFSCYKLWTAQGAGKYHTTKPKLIRVSKTVLFDWGIFGYYVGTLLL